jgi:hypothetical protein
MVGALALAVPLVGAGAQETISTVQGVVRNESNRPVEQAQVLLNPGPGQRELRTDADGRFRFIGVPAGSHRLRVMRIGFQPHDTTLAVAIGANDVSITLQRLTTLGQVAVTARPTGVYGTILSRDAFAPVEGARVELLGARARDTTDAAGAFAMGKAPPGTFMLRVTREGFDTRLISVRVPRDSGVGIDIVLRPGTPALDAHMEMLWADMAQRINWKGVNAAVVGRDEIIEHGRDLALGLRFAPTFAKSGLVIDELACLFVDGIPRPGATIKDFDVEEIESIEAYGRRGEYTGNLVQRWPPKVPCGNPSAKPAPGNRAGYVVIWRRR